MTRVQHTLPSHPTPDILQEQLKLITKDSLQASFVRMYEPHKTNEMLSSLKKRKVMGIDIGGTKIHGATHIIDNGHIRQDGTYQEIFQSTGGKGYVDKLKQISEYATEHGFSVGIAAAGEYDDGRITHRTMNMPIFVEELLEMYDGKLANIFPKLGFFSNDAVIGLHAGTVAAVKQNPEMQHCIKILSGTGLGAAALINGRIFSLEPGHIPVVPELNPHGQTISCGRLGAKYVCLERVAASGAGVVPIYNKLTGQDLGGHTISAMYQKGDKLAKQLYANSARIIAHTIIGIGNAFELWDNPKITTIIYHGGTFNVPGFADQVTAFVQNYLGENISILNTSHDENLCLTGAAIAAVA